MFRNTNRLPKQLAAAIAVVALAAPATSAAYYDLRSPDAKDAAIQAQQQRGYEDLRNPDSRAAAIEAQLAPVAESPPPAKIVESPSFDWGDAGIGAGSVLGLMLITLSVMFTVVHRRNRTATT